MAAAAFNGVNDGLQLSDDKAKMAIYTSGGGWRRRASVFDGGNCLTAMDGSCGSGGRQRRRLMVVVVVAFDDSGSV